MKKIIKITESDLAQIVKRVLNEQEVENINPKNLKLGDKGDDVKKLQQLLFNKGYLRTDSMVPTGFFGKLTNAALKSALSGGVPLTATPSFLKNQQPVKPQQKTTTTIQPKTEVPKKQQKTVTTNDFKDLKISNQVKSQLNYMKSKGYLSNDKFTILDDKNSQVHAFLPGYKLVHTYYVITGKNRGDKLKTQTMGDWVKENWKSVFSKVWKTMSFQDAATYADNCYFGQKDWEMKNTPSGVFKRAGVVENFLGDWLATTFMEKDYGKRFITWETCEGKTIPFGFHGTKNEARLPVLNDKNIEHQSCSKRKMSFGCINFNEQDVQDINSFIDAGQLTIWLPDASDGIVEIPSNCLGSSQPQISRYDQYRMDNKYHLDPGKI
jgi:hypothetical protein